MSNIFDALPGNLSLEVHENLVESDAVRIGRIVSKGHTSPETGWYDQGENEWVMVLRGEAILSFADESSITLKKGDYVNIPAHKKHRLEWTAPDIETIWLAVHY